MPEILLPLVLLAQGVMGGAWSFRDFLAWRRMRRASVAP